MTTIDLLCRDEMATCRLGETLALALRPGDLVTLRGDLGAGKTVLARSLIRAAAGDDVLEVPSPTFTLVQSYDDMPFGSIAHMDLYRIDDAAELDELGIDEALEKGVVVIEWPERAEGLLPEPDLDIALFSQEDASRSIRIDGKDEALLRLQRSLEIRAFLDENGHARNRRHRLTGDASVRAYETIETGDNSSLVLMDDPTQPDGPPIRDGKTYSDIARRAVDVSAFVAIDQLLIEKGFRAPSILAQDMDAGLLLMENLGNDGLLTSDRQPIAERYEAAMETLAVLHETAWPDEVALTDGRTHRIPPYDAQALLIEVELLAQWYAPYRSSGHLSDSQRAEFMNIWRELVEKLCLAEQTLVLRDYHSPNIIWIDDATGVGRTGLIDFQDALIGPATYDVASLAQDARIAISETLEHRLIDHYCSFRDGLDRAAFDQSYSIAAAQRATKILGIFVRLSEDSGKQAYLAHLPHMEAYLKRSLSHPVLADYRRWVETVLNP